MGKKLKIMHGMSEIAGQNTYSVRGLKEIGEDAETVVLIKHPFAYPYDKCLNIDKSNRKKLPLYALKMAGFFFSALVKYDCFHFHFGHSILDCRELPFYKIFRKKVFFEFHGSDLRDHETFCQVSGMPFDPAEATSPGLHARNRKICKAADGIIVHDDELIPYLPEDCAPVHVVPLRVDLTQFDPCYPEAEPEKIRIVHAPSARAIKGTSYVLEAFDRLKDKYDNLEFVLVEGKTQQEAFEIYRTADIIVDQLYAGTYGVFAIESMAMGKPVICYISQDMKEKLPEELPIVSADVHTLMESLEQLIQDGDLRRAKGMASRKYVEDYHDYRYNARLLKGVYYGKRKPVRGRQAFEQARRIKQKMEKKEHGRSE